ncbi:MULTISPECIES: CotD family spore coat protein [Bacillales]|uniref:CotD family spore coat protein n=1 Tax=Lysinibacillus louembei TaxID=1470088 RepID=A0ABZ0RRB4_9BACI|nr:MULTISPECIES: CotD family spore coat protein [Bacillales]MCT6925492.1 spore coat protein [Metasolibacillus sp.]MCT6941749.1 spore coat protein [Metasolibacillus sp.]WPK10764.1 CotD family spore coat protein [Lysinibacillus louembei]
MVNRFGGNFPNRGGNRNNMGFGAWGNNPMVGGNAQYLPTQVGPTQFTQPIVSPTRQYVQTNVTNTVVPHVHPSHLTVVNRQMINNQHYFPHTQSVMNECCETTTMCGQPFNPCNNRRGRR